uniref:Uncharacterized protein n=1 Tax=Cucumis sativus TaxID=3659 RepID=A0A0A0KMG8_CUCSA
MTDSIASLENKIDARITKTTYMEAKQRRSGGQLGRMGRRDKEADDGRGMWCDRGAS